ncbi:Asp-tRNA(Asn)/Glu-tRNA(Gln) amidotransferase subunit GatC [Desulfovibrio sp. OttesenSCG-928-F07]|nr:Asp-tRNA(Asn)/Glu-tRNA(Gln) amidotransferase subunit GatC [Desulfovibrio sp. OttesenSCG-928-F07]
MPVSKQTVIHTSRLARLDLAAGMTGADAEAKISEFSAQMDAIVGYMDILSEADTTGVEPMFSPMALTAPPRADEKNQDYNREQVLENAPEQDNGFFIVPRIL